MGRGGRPGASLVPCESTRCQRAAASPSSDGASGGLYPRREHARVLHRSIYPLLRSAANLAVAVNASGVWYPSGAYGCQLLPVSAGIVWLSEAPMQEGLELVARDSRGNVVRTPVSLKAQEAMADAHDRMPWKAQEFVTNDDRLVRRNLAGTFALDPCATPKRTGPCWCARSRSRHAIRTSMSATVSPRNWPKQAGARRGGDLTAATEVTGEHLCV